MRPSPERLTPRRALIKLMSLVMLIVFLQAFFVYKISSRTEGFLDYAISECPSLASVECAWEVEEEASLTFVEQMRLLFKELRNQIVVVALISVALLLLIGLPLSWKAFDGVSVHNK